MKKLILSLSAALLLPWAVFGGDVKPGSVPGTLNYQGRLERDNAPVSGPVHLYFRIYNSPSALNTGGAACGAVFQPCVWQSPEITAQATQGIFSADITPPVSLMSNGEQLYLEVQVESDTLSPREPLNSVAYALVAAKLQDGAAVSVTTLTAAYQVLLATAGNSMVGIGTLSPTSRLTVEGVIQLKGVGSAICYDDTTCTYSDGVATSVGGVSAPTATNIASGVDGPLFQGNMSFLTSNVERMRINDNLNSGRIGIGAGALAAPMGTVDIDGSLYVGDAGIYDRDDGEVNIMEDLLVEGGRVTGPDSDYISLGEADNVIALVSGGAERFRVHSNGYVGVGLAAPSEPVHAAGNIRANTGVRGADVSIGAYNNTWAGLTNEVRAANNTHLLLQQSSAYNVGIGTNTPREKLHVRGSVRADNGVIASTAAFSGDVTVDGDFDANSSDGNMVYLSSTIVYGTLQVTGGIGSMAGMPAYVASSNTFSGQNTFLNQVTASSDIVANNRLGVGAIGFDFPGDGYLQVGGDTSEHARDALAYLVAGSTGEARVLFYRGAVEAARLETYSGNYLPNLALVVNGQAKTITDPVYHRIQNSVVWISTGYQGTPSIYVSSSLGNVGIGTSIMEPSWKLTVDGNIRISKSGGGLLFPDGTSITTGNLGALSVGNLSNNSDAVVQSNADLTGGGDVILRAGSLDGLVLNTGGNVGIGTLAPVSRLNVRGGDLVLGTPLNPYSSDSVEDLVVAGNIAFDGELLQRSVSQVKLSGLMVAGDVLLSTGPGRRTGIGTLDPKTTLEVNGSAQFGSGAAKSTFTAAGALELAVDLTVPNGGTGAGAFTDGGILFGNGTGALGATGVLANGSLLIGDGDQEPSLATLTQASFNQVRIANAAGGITLSLPQDIHAAADPTFDLLTLTTPLPVGSGGTGVNTLTLNGVLFGNGASGVQNTAAGTQYQVLRAGAGGVPAFGGVSLDQAAAVTGLLPVGHGGSGAATFTAGILLGNGVNAFTTVSGAANNLVKWGAAGATLANSVITDDGTNAAVGAAPTAGIKLDVNGKLRTSTFQLLTGGSNNYVLTSDAGGNATWKDVDTFSGDPRVGNEVVDAANATLTRSGSGTFISPYELAINLGNANTWTAAQAFSAGLSGALAGNASSASALAANPADCTLPQVALGIDANGAAVCSQPSSVSGNAATVTNGVYTTGSYADPAWITSLAGSKVSGNISGNAATATKPQTAGTSGQAVCWKADGTLGYCTGAMSGTSSCTCN